MERICCGLILDILLACSGDITRISVRIAEIIGYQLNISEDLLFEIGKNVKQNY
jgi:hypothetical protein